MHNHRMKHLTVALIGLALLCMLTACGSTSSTNAGATQTQTVQNTTPIQSTGSANQQANSQPPQITTVAMPTTQTSCPLANTARTLVTAPLALGKHQNIVYIVNEVHSNNPTFGTLKRYDVVTGTKTEIVKLANTSIDAAQISADGQWVLFVNDNRAFKKLQAVRMDGQGLQTLYCSSSFQSDPQWSTNQQLITFEEDSSGSLNIYLLHTSNGRIEKVFTQASAGPRVYLIRTWLDNTHLYLVRTTTDSNPDVLSLLDITKGDNQTTNDLLQIMPSGQQTLSLGSFDSSYDGTQLYVNHNQCGYGCSGPSDITVQPALGGTQHTLYSNNQYAVTEVRTVTAHTLLFTIDNEPFLNSTVDQSHNGLWAMNTDGTNLTRLTTYTPHSNTQINGSSQFPWSNVSRDGTTYAATQISSLQGQSTYAIIIGSLKGSAPNTIASIADGTALDIAGWTTM